MSIYSRTLKHVNHKDFRRTHQRHLDEQEVLCKIERQKNLKEKKEIKEIKKLSSPFKSNWREELKIAQNQREEVVENSINKKYDWRKQVTSDKKKYFEEGMTSSGTFSTTLPAIGDVDLSVTSLDSSGFETSADVSFNSGSNSGFTGGFSSGDGIINLGGEGEYSTGVVSNITDLSAFDSVNITAIAGNNFNGGMVPTRSLQVAFFTDTDVSDLINVISPSTNSFTNVNVSIPQQFRTKDVRIILYSNTSDGHGRHGRHFRNQTIPIPGLNHTTISNLFPESLAIYGDNYGGASLLSFYLRDNKNSQSDFRNLGEFFWYNSMVQRFGWFDNVGTQEDPELVYRTWPAAPISGATTENNITDADYIYIGQTVYNLFKGTQLYGISNVSFRRRAPMNVFVSLDSPEATAFIRTDPNLSNLSPKEKQQKLKEMLEASDEYVMKMLGFDFPGTGAVPPGEYDPFAQAPPGEAGDTPGVEIASHDKPFSKYPPAGGPDGWPGLPQDKMDILHPSKDPLLNIPITPFGLPKNWQAGQEKDTQVAQLYPADYDRERAVDQMLLKGFQRGDYGTGPDIDRQIKNLQKNLQQRTPGGLPQAFTNQKYQVANYEPQGQLISEKKKLKSPQEILNKIPGYYDGKPAPLGFPETPPPQMVNGMHPDLVDGKKVADRFNRLDPQSAQAMPLTGNPHIDKKVLKARKQPK